MPDLHSAAAAVSGYLWQLEFSLLLLIGLDRTASIRVEELDDLVSVDSEGVRTAAFQTKHTWQEGHLTSRSPEVWKTLRVWLDASDRLPPRLILALTHEVAADSCLAPFQGKSGPQNVQRLREELDHISDERRNGDLAACFDAWARAPSKIRTEILSRFEIVSDLPTLSGMRDRVNSAVRLCGVPEGKTSLVGRHLVGWFVGRVEAGLKSPPCEISSQDCVDAVLGFSEAVREEGPWLPLHAEDEVPTLEDEKAADPTYLRQLELVEAGSHAMVHAVGTFHRGRAERHEIMNARVAGEAQLAAFEADVVTNWKSCQAREFRGLPDDERGKVEVGRRILDSSLEYEGHIGGAPANRHVSVGTHHLLADSERVGWHPEYSERLRNGSRKRSS